MVVRVGLIFKMKNFFVEGKKINVYKVQDIELGFNTLVNYTDCKDVNTFIRINATDNNNLLKIIIDSNKENLGEDFNREGYYAGLYDDEKFMEYIRNCNGNIDKAKQKVFNEWNGYYILEYDMHMKRVTNKKYIEELDNIFKKDNNNINYSKSNLKNLVYF